MFLYLRHKNWALGLNASRSLSDAYSTFSISVLLTKEGHDNIKLVLDTVFSYLAMLNKEGPDQRIFNEMKRILELEFEYGEDAESIDDVENLANVMQHYPSDQYLCWWLVTDFDALLINTMLQKLTPEKVNIFTFCWFK